MTSYFMNIRLTLTTFCLETSRRFSRFSLWKITVCGHQVNTNDLLKMNITLNDFQGLAEKSGDLINTKIYPHKTPLLYLHTSGFVYVTVIKGSDFSRFEGFIVFSGVNKQGQVFTRELIGY